MGDRLEFRWHRVRCELEQEVTASSPSRSYFLRRGTNPSEKHGSRRVLPKALYACRAIQVGHLLYVYGGFPQANKRNEVFALDSVQKRWSRIASSGRWEGDGIPSATYFRIALVEDKVIFLQPSREPKKVWDFDLITQTWEFSISTGSVPVLSKGYSSNYIQRLKRILLFGGDNGANVLSYDPATSFWANLKAKGDQPEPRKFHSTCTGIDCLYVFGGISTDGAQLYDLHVLSVRGHPQWSQLSLGYAQRPVKSSSSISMHLKQKKLFILIGGESTKLLVYDVALKQLLPTRMKGGNLKKVYRQRLVSTSGSLLVLGGSLPLKLCYELRRET